MIKMEEAYERLADSARGGVSSGIVGHENASCQYIMISSGADLKS
jgi:hypothetical protein